MNLNYGKLDGETFSYAPDVVEIGDITYCTPNAANYAAAGYLPLITDNKPTEVGVEYTPSGWALNAEGTAIERTWTATPIVAPVKVYSVEEVIYGLITHDALAAVKQIVGDYWELFTMRDTLAADNEIFVAQWDALKAAIIASGALTEAEIEEVLKDAEVA